MAELEHAELVRLVTAHAYQAGARYVHVDWTDTPTTKPQRLLLHEAVPSSSTICPTTRWSGIAMTDNEKVDSAVLGQAGIPRYLRRH